MSSFRPEDPIRVLIADEDDSLRALFAEALEQSGLRAALSLAPLADGACPALVDPEAPWDVVIAAAAALDALPAGSPVWNGARTRPLVALAEPGGEAHIAALLEAGIDGYLIQDAEGRYLRLLPHLLGEAIAHFGRMREERAPARRPPSLAERQQEFICHFLPDTTLTYVNPAYCAYFRRSREELIGRRFREFMPEEDAAPLLEGLAGLTPDQPEFTFVHRVRGPGGELRWQQWTDIAIFDASGRASVFHAVGRDITELKESEERYRRLFEGLGDAAFVADAETGVIVDANAAAERLLGQPREAFLHRHHSVLYPEAHREEGERVFDEHVRAGGNLEGRLWLRHVDGGAIPVQGRSTMLEVDGRRRILGVMRDIRKETAAEQTLRQSEERFREFVEGTGDLVFRIDAGGRISYMNGAAERAFGLLRRTCLGKEISEFIHPEDRDQALAVLRSWLRERGPGGLFENRMLAADGVRDVLWTVNLHYEEDGRFAYSNAIGRDITERKRAEDELRASEHALRRLYGIIASRRQDARQTLREFLRFGQEHFGMEAAVICRVEETLCRVYERTGGDGMSWLAGDTFPRGATFCELIRDAGGVLQFSSARESPWQGHPLVEKHGVAALIGVSLHAGERFFGSLAFCARSPRGAGFRSGDLAFAKLMAQWVEAVIESQEAASERERLQAHLQQIRKLESLAIFAGGVAHDFNNLLLGVLGHADLLRGELPADSAGAEHAERIIQAARRGAGLTGQMLAYAGKGNQAPAPVQLNRLIRELKELVEPGLGAGVGFDLDLDEALPPVNCDVMQLRHVLMHLATNAFEAIGEAAGCVTIQTRRMHCAGAKLPNALPRETLPDGVYACVEVHDTGPGISAADRERIFDPFFSTKLTGRGLGLAAALGIVRAHHGAIQVESEPGAGARFRMLLPAERQD